MDLKRENLYVYAQVTCPILFSQACVGKKMYWLAFANLYWCRLLNHTTEHF